LFKVFPVDPSRRIAHKLEAGSKLAGSGSSRSGFTADNGSNWPSTLKLAPLNG